MYYLYILSSLVFKKSYVGITDNIERRLSEHNCGLSFYTKRYRPWKIIYKEECINLLEAREREKYYKSCAGRKVLKKLFNT